MRRNDPQFKIRLPAEMLNQLQSAALANLRTCNAEIVLRLGQSLPALAADRSPEALMAQAAQIMSDPAGRDFCERMARVLNEQRRVTGDIDLHRALNTLRTERAGDRA